MKARVSWWGACEDGEALKRELGERGVLLDEPTEGDKDAVSLTIAVQPTPASAWNARLIVADASGREHERVIQVKSCDELRAALAWVLLVLAREGVVPSQESVLSSAAGFSSGSEGDSNAGAQPSVASAPPTPPPRVEPPPKSPSPTPTTVAVPRSARGVLRVGTLFLGAFGLLPKGALGPALYAEYEPPARGVPAFSVALFQLTTLAYERGGVTLDVARVGGRLGARIGTGWEPLSVALALEAGRLTGSGTGALLASRHDSELWVAAELGPTLRAPLIGRVLAGELGGALAYTPFRYSFQFGDGASLSRSENFEVRLFAGLSAKL
ncbi:MAG TPA: hypothetical protein VFQ35_15100 [Polyangiaceae bacterium]|nr:hypothetical protein [Polyangiaceae bacterium]